MDNDAELLLASSCILNWSIFINLCITTWPCSYKLLLGRMADVSQILPFFCIYAWISHLALSCLAIKQSSIIYKNKIYSEHIERYSTVHWNNYFTTWFIKAIVNEANFCLSSYTVLLENSHTYLCLLFDLLSVAVFQ